MSEEIAGYRIVRELGRGAEGVVYLAESPGLRKSVALKVFDAEHQARYERALETYRALEALREASGASPHLAEGLAAGPLPEGGGFLALAYQASGSLADRVREEGALAAEVSVELTRQVLEGLGSLHSAGLCHRDVKPHNVLLSSEGHAILGDFGLVSERAATISSGGTPAFAAPEQWSVDHSGRTEAPQRRSGIAIDIYGAGATCYYLLTGRSPIPGAPDVFLLESLRVPRVLQAVLLRALAPRAEERFGSAAEFQTALASSLNPPPTPKTQTPKAALGALVVAILAGLVGAVWFGQSGLEAPDPAPTQTQSPSASAALARATTATPARPTQSAGGG
ncbi:MAG: serine/threonine protein kinase, partial [Planctomycetes bacterium]|nr:serine/threonine protein kinase [Planctomycetota bacterium]